MFSLAGQIGPIVRLKEPQDRLADSESRFRALAESAVDAIVSADHSGRIVYLDPRAEQMFQSCEREALGSSFTRLISEREPRRNSLRFGHLALAGDSPAAGRAIELIGCLASGEEFRWSSF